MACMDNCWQGDRLRWEHQRVAGFQVDSRQVEVNQRTLDIQLDTICGQTEALMKLEANDSKGTYNACGNGDG